MLSFLVEMWNAVLGIMIFIGLCGVFCAAMQQLKWKYEPGAKERDLGMLKMGVGVARAFMGK